ncbi:TolC family protein [Fulvivirgaceae bacterium BMA10]|uniref:TolC family protein n=1 Tax=Splendidivirga corallicola TaxID=3051826 RepID=A0ABT8KH42_9BACT|nr:TolC family protein [Fulvivirgaceae bacterium BMA10]
MKKLIYPFYIILILSTESFSQNNDAIVLHLEDFLTMVKKYHPNAKQANLILEKGEATLLNARGAFDPKLFSRMDQKNFEESKYYSLINSGLKIPTWFGMELQTGYEKNQGIYLDPENNTPNAGLYYTGFSFSLGQGFLTDARRTGIRKAQAYKKITELERELALNELLFVGGNVYWDWFMTYHILQVYESAMTLAEDRLSAVRRGALLGDRPMIDTLEMGIQIQNRKLNLQKARLDYVNITARLTNYLWEEALIPFEGTESIVPVRTDSISALSMNENYIRQADVFINQHPELRKYQLSLEQLKLDKRLKKEQIKPVIDLKYNVIAEPINGDPLANYTLQNHTWGFDFSMPLLIRKERGALKLAEIMVQEATLDIIANRASLSINATIALNEWQVTSDQIAQYIQTVEDYGKLLTGGQRLFDAGESSLFMLNSREMSFVNAQIKLIELLAKNQKALLQIKYALGVLNQPL